MINFRINNKLKMMKKQVPKKKWVIRKIKLVEYFGYIIYKKLI